ncbi:MAG: DUF1648 domain-containing protein [Oscillospiraceae bacterium]|jgi:hypothetical protein|nr:DUF1648 domain-containing protein [Oscillospiraceae bacterium]
MKYRYKPTAPHVAAEVIALVCLAALIAVPVKFYGGAPDTIPTRFSFAGEPSKYADKSAFFTAFASHIFYFLMFTGYELIVIPKKGTENTAVTAPFCVMLAIAKAEVTAGLALYEYCMLNDAKIPGAVRITLAAALVVTLAAGTVFCNRVLKRGAK